MSQQPFYNDSTDDFPSPVALPLPNHPGQQQVYRPPRLGSAPIEDSTQKVAALRKQGFSNGLVHAMTSNIRSFPLRIWVVDNSGSMQIADGHRIVGEKNNLKFIPSTRWDEIKDCVTYHAEMAGLLEAPTAFRMLNNPGATVGPQQFGVAQTGSDMISQDIGVVRNILYKARPGGCTPLTAHLVEIRANVLGMANSLNAEGKKVAVIIATDGLPTDQNGYYGQNTRDEFINALRGLEGLPVWVVIRLCTDEDAVVEFYNEIDEQLELSIEVLDDFVGEAKEAYTYNRWLNYALPLHRCREMGFHDRLFDLLDERSFTAGEVRDFCAMLFGCDNYEEMPDPALGWEEFRNKLGRLVDAEELQWNPIKKRTMPWVNLKELDKLFGKPCFSCTVS
mmetsp:Transcript_48730/g.95272  ORF Transcript_48730/g.95272 Transcript_48730/m.95272 type:complete len:392 (+) Transcript_48730:174-1349(+)